MHFAQYYVFMVNIIRIHQIINKMIEIIKLRESLSDHVEYPLNISSQNGIRLFYDPCSMILIMRVKVIKLKINS